MELIGYPFRVNSAGRIQTVEAGSIEHASDAVAVTLLTRKGERPLVPDFGCTDPTFNAVDVEELNVCLGDFGPDGVTVDLAANTHPDDTTTAITLDVTIDEEDDPEWH